MPWSTLQNWSVLSRHFPLPTSHLLHIHWPLATRHYPLATGHSPLFREGHAIALELPFPQRRVGVAGVPDRDLGPPHRHVHPPQGRQDLLVDRIRPAYVFAHRIPDFFPALINDRRSPT